MVTRDGVEASYCSNGIETRIIFVLTQRGVETRNEKRG
jgi:hypothetical protein